MKWLLSAYSQGWNRSRQRRGHVFQGRYKAVPVNASDSDAHYFKALADYIHLNPARAGLAGENTDRCWTTHGAACGPITRATDPLGWRADGFCAHSNWRMMACNLMAIYALFSA